MKAAPVPAATTEPHYRFEVKVMGRNDRTQLGDVINAVASAAYRGGSCLQGKSGVTYDYTPRAPYVVHQEIVHPGPVPAWADDQQGLWEHVEAAEKRVDAQLYREFELTLPYGMEWDQQHAMVMEFIRTELLPRGMSADVSFHMPKITDDDPPNPHAHILSPLRRLGMDGFDPKKERDWNNPKLVGMLRKAWERIENKHLEAAGHPGRVDCRTNVARGIERPARNLSVAAYQIEKRGGHSFEAARMAEEIIAEQALREELAAVETQIVEVQLERQRTELENPGAEPEQVAVPIPFLRTREAELAVAVGAFARTGYWPHEAKQRPELDIQQLDTFRPWQRVHAPRPHAPEPARLAPSLPGHDLGNPADVPGGPGQASPAAAARPLDPGGDGGLLDPVGLSGELLRDGDSATPGDRHRSLGQGQGDGGPEGNPGSQDELHPGLGAQEPVGDPAGTPELQGPSVRPDLGQHPSGPSPEDLQRVAAHGPDHRPEGLHRPGDDGPLRGGSRPVGVRGNGGPAPSPGVRGPAAGLTPWSYADLDLARIFRHEQRGPEDAQQWTDGYHKAAQQDAKLAFYCQDPTATAGVMVSFGEFHPGRDTDELDALDLEATACHGNLRAAVWRKAADSGLLLPAYGQIVLPHPLDLGSEQQGDMLVILGPDGRPASMWVEEAVAKAKRKPMIAVPEMPAVPVPAPVLPEPLPPPKVAAVPPPAPIPQVEDEEEITEPAALGLFGFSDEKMDILRATATQQQRGAGKKDLAAMLGTLGTGSQRTEQQPRPQTVINPAALGTLQKFIKKAPSVLQETPETIDPNNPSKPDPGGGGSGFGHGKH